jgi:hypothetical protein
LLNYFGTNPDLMAYKNIWFSSPQVAIKLLALKLNKMEYRQIEGYSKYGISPDGEVKNSRDW